VARLARRGGDFASLAATWSRDGSTRDKGGDLGIVTASQLDPAYAEMAFAAPLQTVFGPVQTQYGWNVGKVVALRKSQPLTLAQVDGELRAELQNRARLDVWRDYLGDLLETADVEYAGRYLPKDPDAPPADLPE
jgi:peptidyl-prolyl cis-trans isomerase C